MKTIKSEDGIISPESLREAMEDSVAAVMLTCPTPWAVRRHLPEIVEIVHSHDALLYTTPT